MNTLFFLWSAIRCLGRSLGRLSDEQEQQAVEAYLSQSQSINDLECRERQWMRSGDSGSDFFFAWN